MLSYVDLRWPCVPAQKSPYSEVALPWGFHVVIWLSCSSHVVIRGSSMAMCASSERPTNGKTTIVIYLAVWKYGHNNIWPYHCCTNFVLSYLVSMHVHTYMNWYMYLISEKIIVSLVYVGMHLTERSKMVKKIVNNSHIGTSTDRIMTLMASYLSLYRVEFDFPPLVRSL